MSQLHESEPDDQQLVRYLLGLLPDEEAARLDELSIADDEFAWRLRAVENDLVDAYASGTLTGETAERFESFYLSSPRRRKTLRVARSFLRAVDRRDEPPDAATGRSVERATAVEPARAFPAWRLMAVAALLLLACGALLFDGMRLRNGLNEALRASATLDRRAQTLEQQLKDQQVANADAVEELKRARASLVLARQPAAARPRQQTEPASATMMTALVLLPQSRAIAPIATLALPPDKDRVRFELRLESNEFPRYQVALKDPATNQIVWRSSQIRPTSPGDKPTVSVVVPAAMLKPQHYAFELIARNAAGSTEIVGSYAVRIMPR
jgi:hypothetical protein